MSKSWLSVSICAVVATGALPTFGASSLELEKRIGAQSAIEGVYWRHRIWPADNPGPKPSLDEVMPESVLRAKVEDYLLKSNGLERLWARPIQDKEVQAEVERMAASSRAPQLLQEVFAALGNDPILVAECLARPLVADRLIRGAYAHDPRYHLVLKTAIEHSLARHASVAEWKNLGAEYAETVWVLGGGRPERAGRMAGGRVIRMDLESWSNRLALLEAGFKRASVAPPRTSSGSTVAPRNPPLDHLPVGVFSGLQEDDESFFVQAVLEKDSARVRLATLVWRKRPFDEWWAQTKVTLDSSSLLEGAPSGDLSLGAVPSLPAVSLAGCTPDTWSAVQSNGTPSIREAHTAVWTGTEMIVWGGYNGTSNTDTNTGDRYTPATDSWTPTSTTGAPEPRDTHTAVWAGTMMVVWGGGNEVFVPKDTGGRYDPTTNTWLSTTTMGAPTAREFHTAVWSGSRMVVWGGWDGLGDLDTGGRYNPTADSWATTARPGAPTSRDAHTAVWTGTTMVVWGGEDDNADPQNTGGRYDPVGNSWSATATTGAPPARWFHTAVWTGSRMIVWGGLDGVSDLNTGGSYDPTGNTWTSTSTTGAPTARDLHVAVWTDSLAEMDVWGGQNDAVVQLNTGGRYNPNTDAWTTMSTLAAPTGRRYHTGIWSGSELIIWGGWNSVDLDSGGGYCSGTCASSPPAGSSTISLTKQANGAMVSWTAVPVAAAFDLVRGALSQLRGSGGDFTTSTLTCLANDQASPSYLESGLPPAADGFWYLMRGLSCGGAGTYNEIGGSQVGSRDSEINASLNSCP
jgi:N-acetylneuraminic acid mutarotase